MPYSAKAIANAFIDIAQERGEKLTQMKLQKLVYVAHGWNLALLDSPLIEDTIEAWQYGPVIPTLYNEFRGYGRADINDRATDVVIRDNSFEIEYVSPEVPLNDQQTRMLIQTVWDKYGHLSGPNLSDLTHRPGTPWSETFQNGIYHLPIDNMLIRNHFQKLMSR